MIRKSKRCQYNTFPILQLNKEGLLNKEADLKSNGVSIDIVPTVIVETTEEKPMGRKGSLRFRGTEAGSNININF